MKVWILIQIFETGGFFWKKTEQRIIGIFKTEQLAKDTIMNIVFEQSGGSRFNIVPYNVWDVVYKGTTTN